MPGFHPDNAQPVHTPIVIHDFDQWTNPTDSRQRGCNCTSYMSDPSLEYAV